MRRKVARNMLKKMKGDNRIKDLWKRFQMDRYKKEYKAICKQN